MDSGESSLISGDLTSTMENVSVTNEQDKGEPPNVGDSVPSSSSDANVQATVLKAVLDDPISSTSDTINAVSEMNLKNACDPNVETGGESEGSGSNTSELVTDTDFFSSELNIGSISTEKISEDVEDIANDLENLLGESSHEYSVSSNTDRSFDLESLESQSTKNVFEGATQTKDITTTENVHLVQISQAEGQPEHPGKSELISSDETHILFNVQESPPTTGAPDTNEAAENSNTTLQSCKSELGDVSASTSEFPDSDIRCAKYTDFVIQEAVDTKSNLKETIAEDDQSDDEEVYGMILQIRDDNQDSTTGDEARTEEDSQESLMQRDWSVKTPISEETATFNVDLTNIGAGNDQTCADNIKSQQTSEEPSSLLEVQKESGDVNKSNIKEQTVEEPSSLLQALKSNDNELNINKQLEIIVDSCEDKKIEKCTSNTSKENTPTEEANNDVGQELNSSTILKTEENPVEDSTVDEKSEDNIESAEVSSNVIDSVVSRIEETRDTENKVVTENAGEQSTEESPDDEEKLHKVNIVVEQQQHDELHNSTVLNHAKITPVASEQRNEDLTSLESNNAQVIEQNSDVTNIMEESGHTSKDILDEKQDNTCTENIELIAEGDNKEEKSIEAIVQDVDKKNEDGHIQSTSDDVLSDCNQEDNVRETGVEIPSENVVDEATRHSEDDIASNTLAEFIMESECSKPEELPDLNEFQIDSFGEYEEKKDLIEDQPLISDSTTNDNEALCVGIKEVIGESLPENENVVDSVIASEVQSKCEGTLEDNPVLLVPLEEIPKENLNEEMPDVAGNIPEVEECLSDTGKCNTPVVELVENQFSETSEQNQSYKVDTKLEDQLIIESNQADQEQICESDNIGVEGTKENLESVGCHLNDTADLEKTQLGESNETNDAKLTDNAEDQNLIMNDRGILQTACISEVNDEAISLELKVLQSLEESVEAICAISKEETANKEAEDFLEESKESSKFAALEDVGILEVSSTVGVNSEEQKEESDEGLPVDVECFNPTQFVAKVETENCVGLQTGGGNTLDEENEVVDVASMETQDHLLADEILQKEIENLEEQNIVFPILEDNFDDAIESHQDMGNVSHSEMSKLCEEDDQFEVSEACKFIEGNDINDTQDSEETITETIELQLVDDDTDSISQKEECESVSIAEDVVYSKVEEVVQKSTDNEGAVLSSVVVEDVDDQIVNTSIPSTTDIENESLSNVVVEEADDLVVNSDDESGTKEAEAVCIEEVFDAAVIAEVDSELKPTVEPVIDMPEEQPSPEVSSSLTVEVEPQSKEEEKYGVPLCTDEYKRHDSEYSSKMSSDQNLKMTITKHRIEDGVKHDPENTAKPESTHSILKIFESHESIDDKEKETVPRLIIKPVIKPSVEEVEQIVPKITIKPIVEPMEAQLSPKTTKVTTRPESPKVIRSQKCDMLSPLKLTIKPVLKPDEIQPQKSSPKLTIKPIAKVDDSMADSSTSSPKIIIKPIIKPPEEEVVHSPKITIKPIVKPPEQDCELLQGPRITIKPVVKPPEQVYSPKKSPEREHSPRITIKPIVKPTDDKVAKQDSKDPPESGHNPRITIKPLIKPEESKIGKQESSKKTEQEVTSADTSHSPRITIKPIVKPVEEQKQSKQESSTGSPKITIKPIVKPQEEEDDMVHLIDFEEQIKQERIVLKINKTTKSTRKRQAADTTEKLAKIKVKYSRERGRAQIVSGQGKLKRTLEGTLDADFKRVKFEAGDLTITPINPVVQIEKIDSVPMQGGTTVVGIDDPLEKIPVFEITPESAAVLKTPVVAVQPLPPAPRKRGRPRKVPLVVREEFKDVKEEKVEEPPPAPPVEETGRPKRSCRGPSVRTTLGIRARRPRGSSRGRGRGRGSRGGGTRGGRQQRVSAAKLKLLKEEAASAIAEETKRLDTDQKDVEMKEEVVENVDTGTTTSELVIIEEETRMSADINSSRAQTPAKQVLTPAPGDVEDTQSSVQSTATTESAKVRKGTRLEVHQEPEGEVISADQLAEYYWGGGGPFMLQEQVAQFLGIKSFKRKYPGITRRPVDMQERDFIRESGLASEAMCDLGLTAVSSADILDIMYSDFQNKYEEYCKHQRDRQAKDFSNKQKALSLAASQEKNKQDIMQQAVQSAASWNATFNKARKDDRKSCMDLQTFTVHYPKGKMKKIDQPKVGFYPVALVPGQYTDYYKTFTPTELNNLPLNTMLYEPINIDDDSHSDGSGSESDSSSSSSGSSTSDSSGDDNCNVCSPASSTNKKAVGTTN